LFLSQDADLAPEERKLLQENATEDFTAAHEQMGSAISAASLAYCLARNDVSTTPAKRYGEEVVRLGLRSPAVLNNLGYCLSETPAVEDAIRILREARDLAPNLQTPLYNLAIAEFKLAERELKASCMRMAPRRARQSKESVSKAVAHIGAAHLHLNDAEAYIIATQKRGATTARMELTAASIYGAACLVQIELSEADQADMVTKHHEACLNACKNALALGVQPTRLDQDMFQWINAACALPEKKPVLREFSEELRKEVQSVDRRRDARSTVPDAVSDQRLVNPFLEDILPVLVDLPSLPRKSG